MKIYIVMGTTGEYSGRDEWPVMAYKNKTSAQDHVINADRRAKELWTTRPGEYSEVVGINEFDPNMQTDCLTGTMYFIYEVELRETRKQKKENN